MPQPPLSTPLSHLLVAFTIELDNEFERRFAETGLGRRFGISLVMWSNFLRFVGDGITVGELPKAAGLPKARLLSTLGGMERWRYVGVVGPDPETRRDGYGSGRGLRQDWVIRPTEAGRAAAEIWPPLLGEIERRWEERFGATAIDELRESLSAVTAQLDVALPEYLPIVGSANGMIAEVEPREATATPPHALQALLAQVLLAYTLDFERAFELSLPLWANFLRVLDETGMDVRAIPAAAGVSKEATSMALRFLAKSGHIVVDTRKTVSLTPAGRRAQEAALQVHSDVERAWRTRFGADTPKRLRTGLDGVLEQAGRPALPALARSGAAAGRLARDPALRRADERGRRRPEGGLAALPDGLAPRRVARRQLARDERHHALPKQLELPALVAERPDEDTLDSRLGKRGQALGTHFRRTDRQELLPQLVERSVEHGREDVREEPLGVPTLLGDVQPHRGEPVREAVRLLPAPAPAQLRGKRGRDETPPASCCSPRRASRLQVARRA